MAAPSPFRMRGVSFSASASGRRVWTCRGPLRVDCEPAERSSQRRLRGEVRPKADIVTNGKCVGSDYHEIRCCCIRLAPGALFGSDI